MDGFVEWATREAKIRLAPLGRRLAHVQQVARRADEIGRVIVGDQTGLLVAAAYLHDIGYAPELAHTGFHPLDGARFVRDAGFPEAAMLVAHHTGGRNEAALRGINVFADEFPFEDSLTLRALTYCDLTTGPDGTRTTVSARIAEICERYGPDHVVSRGVLFGLPEFRDIEAEVEGLLALSESTGSSQKESR